MKKIRNIFVAALFTLVMAFQTIGINAAELSELQSGIYDIKNDVYHEVELGMTMSRTYLNEDMTLEKAEGKWYYILTFTGTDYMENHRLLIDGEEVEVEVVEENAEENSISLKIETPSVTPDLSTKIYVDAMGRDVEFDIIAKEDTLNLVEAIEEVVEEETEEVVEAATTENKESNNTIIYVVVGVVAVAAIGFVIFKKKK